MQRVESTRVWSGGLGEGLGAWTVAMETAKERGKKGEREGRKCARKTWRTIATRTEPNAETNDAPQTGLVARARLKRAEAWTLHVPR